MPNHTNILVAFANLVNNRHLGVSGDADSHNRANQMGQGLEEYIKDLFCDTFGQEKTAKLREYNKYFSYLGNQNNPPDVMLRGGDAIEIKKIESPASQLALNSSHPKDILHADDPKINQACRTCEAWTEKDMIYAIGHVKDGELKYLWFVYGDCYAAERSTYTRLSDAITQGINTLPDIEFGDTNELARVNKVDPLGITYLRVRGMWGIDNPVKVFDYITEASEKFANLLLLKEKYLSFPEDDRKKLENLARHNNALAISDIQIKDPNNPANLLDAKIITLKAN